MNKLQFTLIGQYHGGKNNICVTRSGHRFPNKQFAKWSKEALIQLDIIRHNQGLPTYSEPIKATVHYYAEDKRRRDITGVMDGLFHVLEKANIVRDDCLIKDMDFRTHFDKDNPRLEVTLEMI